MRRDARPASTADGTVDLTDKLQDRLGWNVTIPERDGNSIRLIDLATHASGLPREAEVKAVGDNPTVRDEHARTTLPH